MSTRSSSPEFASSRDESLSSKAPLMSDLEAQVSEPVHQSRQKCLKFSIVSLVVVAVGCLGGSFAYANLHKFTSELPNEKTADYSDLPEEPLATADEMNLSQLNPTVKEAILGRWQEKAKFNVSEYIDAEDGPTFYKMFAKKMTADLEYTLVDLNVYTTTFYVSWMPPLKYPMRLDQPYEHKSPSGDPVTSVAQFRPEFDDIFVNTQGGREGPVNTRIQVIDGELILTSTMVEKNVSCKRIYTRKAT